jgi:hypothetical protein
MADEQTATTSNDQTAQTTSAQATETKQNATAQSNILAEAEVKTEEASAKTEDAAQKTEDGKAEAKTEEKTGEKKPEEKKPEPRAPEEYAEFKVPEGTTLDEQTGTEFKGLAKELDLTQEQAQKLLDFGGDKLRAQIEAPYKLWAETQAKWQAEVKADPEIGGTKFEQSIKDAAQVFAPGESNPFVKDAAEAKALREALNMTGAGNNPAIVKLFVKMGKVLAEPGSLSGGPVKDSQGTLLAKMYPTMNETT